MQHLEANRGSLLLSAITIWMLLCPYLSAAQAVRELEALHVAAAEQLEGLYEARLALEAERMAQLVAARDDLELSLKVWLCLVGAKLHYADPYAPVPCCGFLVRLAQPEACMLWPRVALFCAA